MLERDVHGSLEVPTLIWEVTQSDREARHLPVPSIVGLVRTIRVFSLSAVLRVALIRSFALCSYIGDNGRTEGGGHQNGWAAFVARLTGTFNRK